MLTDLKWTKNQEKAIKTKGSSIIVSAAAGSGKTEILSQRIVERVLLGSNINEFLIVTFTNAAAEQMKQRINKKIYNLIVKNPENNHLKKQEMLMPYANIQTIHGFCKKLIKDNFNLLNVSPNFNIVDNSGIIVLKKKAIDLVLENFYREASENFISLVNSVSSQKDDLNLVNLIEKLQEFLDSLPFPEAWMETTINNLSKNSNIWQNAIIDYSKECILEFKNILTELINYIKLKEKVFKIYSKFLLEELEILKNIENSFRAYDFQACRNLLKTIIFPRLPSSRKCDDSITKEKILYFHKKIKDSFKKILENFDEENCLLLTSEMEKLSLSLFDVVKKIKSKFSELKKEKNILDFSDLEHMALKLLVLKNGTKTILAEEISLNFEEILIDEYQDTNEIQETIFKAISKKEKNLFMVGDVKQSIYSFRKAKPEIFIKRQEKSSESEIFNVKNHTKIFLKENFRSNEKILNFVNFLFSNIMTKSSCNINYEDQEKMIPFKKTISENIKNEIYILEIPENKEEKTKKEAEFVAKKINKMLKSGYKHEDICILFRSIGSSAKIFKNILENFNIKTSINSKEDFFVKEEISMIICLLQVINNKTIDTAVVGVLMSPLFNFDVNKISLIRCEKKEMNFYCAVELYAEKDSDCAKFLKKINELYNFSQNNKIDLLVNKIYSDFNIFSLIKFLRDSENKSLNLKKLMHFIKTSRCDTISEFLNFVDKIRENKILINTNSNFSSDSVKIMSIHGAKGLEFPICIIANCSFEFHYEKDDIVFDEEFGIGMRIFNIKNMKKYNSIQRDVICLNLKKKQVAEEIRILYVAITRAKQKVIIILSFKDLQKKLEKLSIDISLKPNIFMIKNAKSFSDWILMALLRHPAGKALRQRTDLKDFYNGNINLEDLEIKFLNFLKNKSTTKIKEKEKIFSYFIPYENEKENNNNDKKEKLEAPRFLNKNKLLGSDIGNVYHKFMQYLNFEEAKKNIEKYILKLVDNEVLTSFESKILNRNKIKIFLNSALCQRIINSSKILKEYDFMVKESGGNILQGTIDLVFEENKEFFVVDYKTTTFKNSLEFIKKYNKQLQVYKYAVKECLGIPPKQMFLYSFYLGKAFAINPFQNTVSKKSNRFYITN